ncbi:MAG: DUF1697 domain-containing protein [Sphingomonadales bacterium]|nr:DUF1697 domain-containing protein [Sphingomonadales bacterium]MBD3774548.1 DUF1697 domain-containing protein [Paracoccaceae bacterium]
MARYVALLGSINVGGNRLKMADLVAALEKHGFSGVATVVASGNVLFDHPRAAEPALQDEIAKIVQEEFGIASFAVVRSRAELEQALAESPFADQGEDKLVHVHFLAHQPDKDAFDRLVADHAGRGSERLALGTRALHIDFVDGVAGSKLTGGFLEKRLGGKGTARNVRSIGRIIEQLG